MTSGSPTCARSSRRPPSCTGHSSRRSPASTSSEARDQLMAQVVDEAKRAAMSQVREIEQRAREEGEERARKVVTIAIQRVASEQTAESTVSVFALPSEDMKGRIIGREGRNIRAFESVTGVNLIIDDTPEAVVLSCFDPVRREAARHDAGASSSRTAGSIRRGSRRSTSDRTRARGARSQGGGGRGGRGRHHRHPPRDDQAPRPAAVPHVVRAERAAPPRGVGAHREQPGRGDRCRPARS